MTQHPELLETLRQAQRFGFFGARPIDEAVEHAMAFVTALRLKQSMTSVVDLGSGGGLPGLVIADAFRDTPVVLIDRREKRTDFLRRAVSRLDFPHVTVMSGDVETLCRQVESAERRPFAGVTARGFGPPDVTLRFARRLLAPDGMIVISEPPSGNRWAEQLLDELGLATESHGSVRTFRSR